VTDIIIDSTTGLPELPEGHFWSVKRTKVHDYGFAYFSGFAVVWMEPNPTGKKRVHGRKHWYWLFSSYYDVPCTEPREKARGTVYTDVQGARTEALELRPDEILEAAVKVVQKVADDERTIALLGDYPPKRLTCEDNKDSVS
jgi:hypothetical protein